MEGKIILDACCGSRNADKSDINMSDEIFIKPGYYWVRTRGDGDIILLYGPDDNNIIIGWWYGNEYYDRENILMRLSPEPIANPYI